VLFSCKITHSVITYLDRRGEDLEALYDRCDWPSEFLRDPSSWLEADKMEALLKQIDYEYSRNAQGAQAQAEESLIVSVGHQCKDLRAWGVLDSVLRMVQAPKDLFAQPERFLSYFISPAPPLGEVRRDHESVSFVLPVSDMQFPFVTQYLRAALEALPTYISKPMASVQWDNSRVTVSWSEQQASLFGDSQAADLSLHPELVRNILLNLESSQKQLDELQRSCLAKDREIEELKKRLTEPPALVSAASTPSTANEQLDAHVGEVLHELYRLGDYVARGHQLVTLLIGQGRNTPQIQEAMRRVNWDFVATQGPLLVKWAVGELQKIQNNIRDNSAQPSTQSSEQPGGSSSALPLESRAQEQLEGRLL
jgi:hypothetical protein